MKNNQSTTSNQTSINSNEHYIFGQSSILPIEDKEAIDIANAFLGLKTTGNCTVQMIKNPEVGISGAFFQFHNSSYDPDTNDLIRYGEVFKPYINRGDKFSLRFGFRVLPKANHFGMSEIFFDGPNESEAFKVDGPKPVKTLGHSVKTYNSWQKKLIKYHNAKFGVEFELDIPDFVEPLNIVTKIMKRHNAYIHRPGV